MKSWRGWWQGLAGVAGGCWLAAWLGACGFAGGDAGRVAQQSVCSGEMSFKDSSDEPQNPLPAEGLHSLVSAPPALGEREKIWAALTGKPVLWAKDANQGTTLETCFTGVKFGVITLTRKNLPGWQAPHERASLLIWALQYPLGRNSADAVVMKDATRALLHWGVLRSPKALEQRGPITQKDWLARPLRDLTITISDQGWRALSGWQRPGLELGALGSSLALYASTTQKPAESEREKNYQQEMLLFTRRGSEITLTLRTLTEAGRYRFHPFLARSHPLKPRDEEEARHSAATQPRSPPFLAGGLEADGYWEREYWQRAVLKPLPMGTMGTTGTMSTKGKKATDKKTKRVPDLLKTLATNAEGSSAQPKRRQWLHWDATTRQYRSQDADFIAPRIERAR